MGSQITKGKQLDIFLKTQLPSKSELWMGSWRAERQQLGSLRDHLPPMWRLIMRDPASREIQQGLQARTHPSQTWRTPPIRTDTNSGHG